ncbi:MAG: hypothetical protein H6821_13830 [Planctomycetaceae bacterium]|nr:hypothetical protein [Planctomycetales bacterium]MCB9875249.1 hypothetical protein [Planctomycetaceae bacterium]HRX77440.1 hypothetical protein [Pirellulaceae bacterium]
MWRIAVRAVVLVAMVPVDDALLVRFRVTFLWGASYERGSYHKHDHRRS